MRLSKLLTFPLIIFVLLFALAAGVHGQGSSSLFDSPWQGYDTGRFINGSDADGFGPVAIKAADLDKDGDADLVVGNYFSPRPGLSVLLNAGDGTYGQPMFYALPDGKSIGDVALSDVDKDGDVDVLATVPDFNGLSNLLALWRNNGDGTFAPYTLFNTGPGPKGIALADFNGDGFTDIATANYGSVSRANNTVSVILHNGQTGAAAGFLPHTEFTVSGMDAQRVAAADVNGDGRPDIAVGGKGSDINGGKIAVLFNDGAGGFNVSAYYVSYPDSRLTSAAVALADLDKDGDADLIAGGMFTSGSTDKGLISVRRNAGNGTFGAAEAHLFEGNVSQPASFALGDLNRDGYTDIVACTPSGRTMDGWVALLSNGSGGFHPTTRYEASQQTLDAVIVDDDRDKDLDVITVAQSSAAITVHRNSGIGTFDLLFRNLVGQESNGLVGNVFAALEAGDIDRDGDIDLVTNDEKAYILKNNGKGTFATAVAYTPPINAAEVKLRDLNGDGHLDLLFGPDRTAPPYHFGTSLNNGDGTFATGTVVNVNACQAGSIDAFDLDGDGDLDVVLTEEGSCQNGPGFRIFIFRNAGRANFTLATTLNPPCGPSGIGGGDLNGDGRIDLVTRSCAGAGVYPGKGDLTFAELKESGSPFFKFKLADLNGDGRLDLAMILTNIPAYTTLVGTSLGNGDGTFAAARTQSGSSVLEQMVISNDIDVADADGDGDGDLFVTNDASNDLSLFYNEGDGSMRRHERYGIGNLPTFSAVADFDKDGAVDVASNIGLPQFGLKRAVVTLHNKRLDVIVGVPNAMITSPADLSTYDAPATIHVTAEVIPVQGRPITKVDFYLGDGQGGAWKLVHTDTTAPYGFDLTDQQAGTYSLYAVAHDSEDVGISSGARYTVKSVQRYNISGRITSNGTTLSGVSVALSGAMNATVVTDASGDYSFSGLASGNYTVTPSLSGYVFTPASYAYATLSANQTANFAATPDTAAPPARTNVALSSEGATVLASSVFSASYPASAVNNGDRRGVNWEAGGGWNDATGGQHPDWVEVRFGGTRTLSEVDVFTIQDEYANPTEPTSEMTFTKYGITDFTVSYWNGTSWLIVPGGSISANGKVWTKLTFPSAITTDRIRVMISGALAGFSRLIEVEAWQQAAPAPTPTPTPNPSQRTNVALASAGATTLASSAFSASYPATAVNDGDRRGTNWEAGGGWNDGTLGQHPDWVEVSFAGVKTIDEVDVFTLQDNYASPAEPTAEMLFTQYGVTDFEVQSWNGASWVAIPGARVTANGKVWSKFTFPALTTTKIKVVINNALAGYSRLTEVEAWQAVPPARPNLALASAGATVIASSVYSAGYPAEAVNNGDRRGVNWEAGGGWNDATPGQHPDWVEVRFGGARTLSEVDVFTIQDEYANPTEPTTELRFTQYGVTDFTVQHWDGANWIAIPGASVTGNGKVWQKFTFSPITTDRIRVVVTGALAGYSRLTEVEAYQ